MEVADNHKRGTKEPVTESVVKWWHIDSKLILLKGHYFFFFGSLAAIIPPIILYSQQLGLSLSMVGTLFAVLPFIQCVAKAIGGAVADKFQIHKAVLIFSVVAMGAAAFSMNFIPGVPKSGVQSMSLARQPTFLSSAARLSCDSTTTTTTDVNLRLEICRQHTTFATGFNATINGSGNDSRWPPPLLPDSSCNLSCGALSETDESNIRMLFCADVAERHCSTLDHRNHSFYDIRDPHATQITVDLLETINVTGSGDCVSFVTDNITLSGSAHSNWTDITVHGCPSRSRDSLSLTCSVKCFWNNRSAVGDGLNSSEPVATTVSATGQVTWLWLGCIVTWSMYGVALSIADAFLVSTLGDNQNNFGKTRLFASVGWGLISPIGALIIEYASEGLEEKDYRPGFYLFLALVVCDLLVTLPMKATVSELRPQKLIKEVIRTFRRPTVFLFAVAVFFEGVATGVMWTFGIVYANELNGNPLVIGLTYAVECFLSEIPFFWASGWIVGKLGHATSLSVALFITGLKSLFYSVIPDAWYMLLIALIHGVTYGLLYSTMATYAHLVAPPGACATLQGIFQGIFEGVGAGVGSFLGGLAYDTYGGSAAFRIFGLWIMGVAALYQMFILISSRRKSNKHSLEKPAA